MNAKSILTAALTLLVLHTRATTYYISSVSGNDENMGTTTEAPWQSLNKVSSTDLMPGDSVLFKGGEEWRGQLLPKSGDASGDIYYGAYDLVDGKPTFLGSESYNDAADWIDLGDNIWECNTTFTTDIGNIIFDEGSSVGFKKWESTDLTSQNDFWYDLNTGTLQIYTSANPTTLYNSIELALRQHIVDEENTSYVTYENLALKYGGAHGFGGGNTSYISIFSCDISYMGGGDLFLNGEIRFGNGVEFWGNASNNRVEKCRIWEIYDTGITNQNNTENAVQENISYRNNIIWNCGLSSYEYWNRPESSQTDEIYFEHNTCLYAGSGWGSQRPDYQGSQVILDINTAQTGNIYIRNNIFHTAQRFIYAVEDNINGTFELDYNSVYQSGFSDSLFIGFPSFVNYRLMDFTDYVAYTGQDANSISVDPMFVAIDEADYQLADDSPCIDAGTTTLASDDFVGNQRPMQDGYDIGAYEYVDADAILLDLDADDPNVQIFPNPFNSTLYIDNTGAKIAQFSIMDVSGHTVIQSTKTSSLAVLELDLSLLKSGIYLWIATDRYNRSLTRRLVKY